MQIYQLRPGSKILVCAPNETAVDMLVLRLSNVLNNTVMFRLFSTTNEHKHVVHRSVLPYCQLSTSADGLSSVGMLPSGSEFANYAVVVGTCLEAGKIFNYGVSGDKIVKGKPKIIPDAVTAVPTYFDVVLIDDCDQIWEPEAIACFSTSLMCSSSTVNRNAQSHASNKCQVILVGDDQMPIRSDGNSIDVSSRSKNSCNKRCTVECNLNISLLERLLMSPSSSIPAFAAVSNQFVSPYKRDLRHYPTTNGYNPLALTKLNIFYKNNPSIMSIVNQISYNGEIVADTENNHYSVRIPSLVIPALDTSYSGMSFPVWLHNVSGTTSLLEEYAPTDAGAITSEYYCNEEVSCSLLICCIYNFCCVGSGNCDALC